MSELKQTIADTLTAFARNGYVEKDKRVKLKDFLSTADAPIVMSKTIATIVKEAVEPALVMTPLFQKIRIDSGTNIEFPSAGAMEAAEIPEGGEYPEKSIDLDGGSSVNIKKRINDHLRTLKQGKHHSSKLQKAYNRAGDKTIFIPSVLELVIDKSDLFSREQYWIDKYDAFNAGYNCSALADNPKYTLRDDKKKKSEIKCAAAYKKFWTVYDKSRVHAGTTLLSRIRNKYYKFATINAISSLLDYLMDLYNPPVYTFNVGYRSNSLYIDICGSDGNRFVEYGWKNKKPYIAEELTNMIRENLAREHLLNNSLHAILRVKGCETYTQCK